MRKKIKKYFQGLKEQRAFRERFARVGHLLEDGRFLCSEKDLWPCLDDATRTTGFDAHYVYHTAWAARILAATRPQCHTDIGSCLRFVTLLSAFVPINFYDYRPAAIGLPGLRCEHANLTALHFADASIESLSCMHVVEHIGLERYGDAFDPQGDLRAMAELARVLAVGGSLLFVVPVGEIARIQYNAHRIYTYRQIIDYFAALQLHSFSLIDDRGQFILEASENDIERQKYACGCFYFQK